MYERKAQYHETDQMGVIHHANYFKWFEEARISWLAEFGIDFAGVERSGILSPVTEIGADFKKPVLFGDTVCIDIRIIAYNGAVLGVRYTVTDKATGQLRCTGQSRHCFVDKTGRLISLKRADEALHSNMKNRADEDMRI
jgi:acyl-CoA thioester hydrolase